ncbi:leukocyte receptor cluster member 1 homolog [Athalia rosae]|uniref:leukocyte receptor cluster member 1 homolog n=1 Tax=Athalia rosae TaxID=37344 RepID=UPI00203485FC|nr:leukocyte receptor cluster member 1 homolog [Athalia rosae]
MNILPKKRWHVRTKDNIARVRRDEAKAAEEEKAIKARIQKAETEARTNLLRNRARLKYDGRELSTGDNETADERLSSSEVPLEHVNFFIDVQDGKTDYSKPNADHEVEKKAEQEKYEKQIGYLTYLGQDTNEATGNKSWYNELPKRLTDSDTYVEATAKTKFLNDPLNDVRKYLKIIGSTSSTSSTKNSQSIIKGPESAKRKYDTSGQEPSDIKEPKKRKKRREKLRKQKKSRIEHLDTSMNLEKLRSERLKRETNERFKEQALLAKLNKDPIKKPTERVQVPTIRQKYNSQFNPEIARQNAERIHKW